LPFGALEAWPQVRLIDIFAVTGDIQHMKDSLNEGHSPKEGIFGMRLTAEFWAVSRNGPNLSPLGPQRSRAVSSVRTQRPCLSLGSFREKTWRYPTLHVPLQGDVGLRNRGTILVSMI